MPEEDGKIFQEAFGIYNKYRWEEIKTPERWKELMDEIRDFAVRYRYAENVLAVHMSCMLIDTFNDLYKDGKKPVIPDYFGRNDL